MRKRKKDNVLHEHKEEFHKDEQMTEDDFKMKITGRYHSSLARQTSEALQIAAQIKMRDKLKREKSQKRILVLNSKKQFHQPGVIRSKPSTTPNYDPDEF